MLEEFNNKIDIALQRIKLIRYRRTKHVQTLNSKLPT